MRRAHALDVQAEARADGGAAGVEAEWGRGEPGRGDAGGRGLEGVGGPGGRGGGSRTAEAAAIGVGGHRGSAPERDAPALRSQAAARSSWQVHGGGSAPRPERRRLHTTLTSTQDCGARPHAGPTLPPSPQLPAQRRSSSTAQEKLPRMLLTLILICLALLLMTSI